VVEGTARLRIALSASLDEAVIAALFDALAEDLGQLS
jgi:7-keto-8-aminopelargonate synthetase-like enzyme